eukprot:maker-scaffold_9-snap-gene-11.10-mRNA-1 protein AED:0.02 eAED:0.02 QI:119/1/1/1/0.6/0.66/6/325/753
MSYFMTRMLERQDGVDDLCLISDNKKDSITNQLSTRLSRNKIYTSIGEVLVAVNPYRVLNIYGQPHIQKYQNASLGDTSPHIYGLAERAYRRMKEEHKPQAVIISGESGAGKTESAKLLLHYISSVSGSSSISQRMKNVILQCNPLLESFGNAKTVRNNNSSRFGKYLNLFFNERGEPIGGTTTNFLLEKTRVTFQQNQERNFHIFYQLLASKHSPMFADFFQRTYLEGLGPEHFYYLSQSGTYHVDGYDDAQVFQEVIQAMATVSISQDEQWMIFGVLAAILHLGNVYLVQGSQPNESYLSQESESFLQTAAYLLGVDPNLLNKAITHKKIQMGGRRGSVVEVPQNADQATQIRDALAKELFSRTFDHIVNRVNQTMYPENFIAGKSIGILDIYGFEIFENNSFEQFCINYVNEKLQQIFIQLTIKGEQVEYKQEGLPWKDVQFFDNEVVVKLIEGSNPPGLMRLLDDTGRALHAMDSRAADSGFMDKINGTGISSHQHLRVARGQFTIQHYAGNCTYNVDGFVFKNIDTLYHSVIDVMQMSQNQFVNYLWQNEPSPTSNARKSPTTSSMKIRTSAKQLVESLEQCAPHYIRCIKPNERKMEMTMEKKRVEHQVQYLGLVQNVEVKKAGYSYRATYATFLNQFGLLNPAFRGMQTSMMQPYEAQKMCKELCSYLSSKYNNDVPTNEWAFGRTKLFVDKPTTIFFLEELKEQTLDPQGYAEKVRMFEEADREAERAEAKMKKPAKKSACCVVS